MATRLYLRATATAVPFSVTPDTDWEDTTFVARAMTSTAKIADTLATVSVDDADSTNRDVLVFQYITALLAPGQTITGSQAIKAQCRALEASPSNNMVLSLGIRVIAIDGSTVRKTVLAVTRDAVEFSATALTNRQFTATSAATDYTTVAGDRLVIEIGAGGDPSLAAHHDFSLRLGDSAASDLPEDDTDTTDLNPWVELADTLTFGDVLAQGSRGRQGSGARVRGRR